MSLVPIPNSMDIQAGIYAPTAIQLFSNLHDSPGEAIRELIENGLDAGKERDMVGPNHRTRILLYLSRSLIVVSDNGHGMSPFIKQEDQEALQMYMEDVQAGKMSFHDRIHDYVHRASMKTGEWLLRFPALSAKQPRPGEKIRGRRGIGLQSARMVGNSITIWTKASPQLAMEYWGPDILQKGIPVVKSEPPTAQQLSHGDLSSKITLLD